MSNEPLLEDESNLYTRLQIRHHDIWEFRELHHKTIWHANEIDMSSDLNDWNKMTDNERHFIKYILTFFANSDGIVMKNISTNFSEEIKLMEARSWYAIQNFMEDIHNETYANLINIYISNEGEQNEIRNAIYDIPGIKKKADFALKYTDPDNYSFAMRLVAFAIVEGLFFSSAFSAIYFIKDQNRLSGLCASNDLIARDEGLHVDFAVMLYNNYVTNKLSQSEIDMIVEEAVGIEKEFILESLPCDMLGMNSKLMSQYIEFVANRLMVQMGYVTKYSGIKCPFPFMDKIALENQTSFFDKRPTEYQRNRVNENSDNINFDTDF
jgi:ribonucleoside-diphosphate reductase beta chain